MLMRSWDRRSRVEASERRGRQFVVRRSALRALAAGGITVGVAGCAAADPPPTSTLPKQVPSAALLVGPDEFAAAIAAMVEDGFFDHLNRKWFYLYGAK